MRLQISRGFHASLGDDIYAGNSCYLYRMPSCRKTACNGGDGRCGGGGGAFLQRQKVDEMQREIADTECNVATSSANTRTRTRAMRRLDAVLAMRRTGETPSQPAEPGSFVERCRMEQLRTGLLVEPNSPEEEEAARRYAEMRVKQETKRSIQRGARHKAMQAA